MSGTMPNLSGQSLETTLGKLEAKMADLETERDRICAILADATIVGDMELSLGQSAALEKIERDRESCAKVHTMCTSKLVESRARKMAVSIEGNDGNNNSLTLPVSHPTISARLLCRPIRPL